LLVITLAALAFVGLQLVPIPWDLWSQVGPRPDIAGGYELLGLGGHAEPLSLTPYDGLDSLLRLIPPFAIFCVMIKLKTYHAGWLALALAGGALGGTVLGALQVASPSQTSSWYFYSDTNFGSAVGFFANVNHMGMLLVITFPFLAAMAAAPPARDRQRYSARLALTSAAGLLVLVGIALNGSLAAYGLALPVLAASALIVFPANRRMRMWVGVGAVSLLVTSVALLEVTPIGANALTAEAITSVQSRDEVFSTTWVATRDFFPFGSGLGSFPSVYHLYEDPTHVTLTTVVHAHNDYLELALEIGIAGILLMIIFIGCWAVAAWRAWRAPDAPFARAAAIASAAILAHSLVDFPLRTAAISSCFAVCLALLANQRIRSRDRAELRPTRHVAFE
jgi:O-antigen ligase